MLEPNPTRTLTIERNWQRDINRRWRQFTKDVTEELRRQNQSGLETNQETPFTLDASQIRIYMNFYTDKINELLLGTPEPPNWQATYQLQAYQRGLERARASLISQGADLIPTPAEALAAQGLAPFTATPTLGTATLAPIHQDAIEFLFSRSYESLNGWTDALARETRQILVDGLEQGKGIRSITDELVDRIGVSKSRAELISRTETIQALQRASTNESKRAEEELGEEILMRWITALDSRVRDQHRAWHGTLSTPEDNFKRINISPWRCRCAQVPVIKEANTPKKNEKFKKERERLLALEKDKS